MYEIIVNEVPVAKGRPRLGRGRVFTPRKTELAESRIRAAWLESSHACAGAGQPLLLEILVRVGRPAAHFGSGRNAAVLRPSAPLWPAGRPDWDNYAKTVCDALNGVAWADDGQIVAARVWKTYCEPGETPGWTIRTTPYIVALFSTTPALMDAARSTGPGRAAG